MAISKPNLTRIWAADAAGSDVVDPDVQTPGKFALGWGAEKPPYQFFNFMQKLFTQGLGYFDEQGIAFWNTDTDYQDFSITKGSTGRLYLLKASGDGTEDPVDDAGTNWTQLPTRAEVDSKTEKPSETTITASTTFANSTNNIALPGVGSIGLEIGDVVRVTGTADNNKLFTVEVITDSGNVIVNQAHAGGSTSKALVNETVTASVTLLTKWYNASSGLGRGLKVVTRVSGTTYTNSTGREIAVFVVSNIGSKSEIIVDGTSLAISQSAAAFENTGTGIVPSGSTYLLTGFSRVTELR